MAGVVVLKSAGMEKYMNENVSGVFVPDDIIRKDGCNIEPGSEE
jgi:hypothetical protein